MKIVGWIIVIVISAIVATLAYIGIYFTKNKQQVIDNIKYKFDIGKINFSQIISLQPKANVDIEITIENKNPIFIIFSDLNARLFQNGLLIAKSKKTNTKSYIVPINGEKTFVDTFEVNLNILKLDLQSPIDYEIDVRIFGIKIETIKSSFTI